MTPAARIFRAGSLAAWGFVCLSFVGTGRIASYLHPSFHPWTLFSGVVLVVLAAIIAFTNEGEEECHGGCEHDHRESTAWLMARGGILVIPLLAAVVVSPSQFGPVAVMNRGLAESLIDLPGYTPYREPALPNEDGSAGEEGAPAEMGSLFPRSGDGRLLLSPVDMLYAANLPEMMRDINGRQVEVIGQFFPAKRNNPHGDRFSLVRMYVLCCAADARPVAVSVRSPSPESFPDMSWVKVRGHASFPTEGGRPVPLLTAESVEPCEAPPESFLY